MKADLFPGALEAVYLDTAATGIVSTRVVQAMQASITDHLTAGVAAGPRRMAALASARESVARLIGGHSDRVAFTANTTTGLALVVNGMDWGSGDNVVVPAGEFASNLYPWLTLAERGVEIRRIPFRDGHAPVEDIVANIDSRTRVVTMSAVQYDSGYRYGLTRIAAACRGQDTLFAVDGTQAVGALAVEVTATDIDVLAVGAYKWLMGPFGVGFVHLSDRAMHRLTPSVVGWASAEEPFAFLPEPVLSHDARRFEPGSWNAPGIAGLGASVDLALELGPEWIESEVLHRAAEVAQVCEQAGLTVTRDPDPAHHSGIVVATTGARDAHEVHATLASRRIRCSVRGDTIRFSPHYFTSHTDINLLAYALSTLDGRDERHS